MVCSAPSTFVLYVLIAIMLLCPISSAHFVNPFSNLIGDSPVHSPSSFPCSSPSPCSTLTPSATPCYSSTSTPTTSPCHFSSSAPSITSSPSSSSSPSTTPCPSSSSTPSITPCPSTSMRPSHVVTKTHVFKYKVVYLEKRRCDLVCHSFTCRYCHRIKIPVHRFMRVCHPSYSGLECSFVRKTRYVYKFEDCLSYQQSIGVDFGYEGHDEDKVVEKLNYTLPPSGLQESDPHLHNGFEEENETSAFVTHGNHPTPRSMKTSLATALYVFKHKVVFLSYGRCDLVCRHQICRYCHVLQFLRRRYERVCHQSYYGTKCMLIPKTYYVSKFGSCLSHNKSIEIDIEYRGHFEEGTSGGYWVPKRGLDHASGAHEDTGNAEKSKITTYASSVPSSSPCAPQSSKPCAPMEHKRFAKSAYIFKNKVVYVSKRRCELVCRKEICQYCETTNVPHIRHERVCRSSYNGRDCKFVRKVEYVQRIGGCLSYENSVGVDMGYKGHEQHGEVGGRNIISHSVDFRSGVINDQEVWEE